ncbi:MAG: hypothetical protein QNL98_14585 [Mycobacterium sp.]
MPTEVTASVLIGPLSADSVHGRSESAASTKAFCPSHVLTLMEGARATWVMQRCPELGHPIPTWFIRPSVPEHLLGAVVLGYVALISPEAIQSSDALRGAVVVDTDKSEVRILPLTDALAAEVFAVCGRHVYGLVTRLQGSTVCDYELRAAADSGFLVSAVGAHQPWLAT